ncbi:MAG: universal stress protein [Acinetobacter sp.]|uniref:universal stress protein n=1 Tax=Acinetobacter sp. TaxID=472 RepID=UPI0026DF8253|nr:universal stress protein [Acinetobacter sp.]MDO5543802.1 universal stress protein [Acinetobacter sp.]
MSFQNIVVPVDGSKISFAAVQHAAEIAKACQGQLSLVSLVAEDPYKDLDFAYYYISAPMKEYFVQVYANAEKALQEASAIAAKVGVTAQTQVIKSLSIGQGIIEFATAQHADCIVMGSHGRTGMQKMLLGSVAAHVLGTTELPVLIVKAES